MEGSNSIMASSEGILLEGQVYQRRAYRRSEISPKGFDESADERSEIDRLLREEEKIMLISAIPSATPTSSILSTLGPPKAAQATAVSALPALSQTAATTASAAPASAPAPAKAATAQAAPAPAPSVSSALVSETLAAVYSTTVGGKQYTGDIDQSNGQYTASVPNLTGASASGSSIMDAEIALGARIDAIV
jgi:hypothetical protein